MLKHKVIAFILFTAVLITTSAYCQQGPQDQQIQTISGKVTKFDIEGGVLHVKTDLGDGAFYLTAVSDLFHLTHHMASVEITIGDPVVIQYVHSAGINKIIKLVDNRREVLQLYGI